jgi:uncharacterized RDD family membrane protein YckC
MTDPLPCPTCSFANAPGAESCAKCGAVLAETPERVHPGETLRDPDDLTLPPPSPLLRAVLRGEPDAFISTRETTPPDAPSRSPSMPTETRAPTVAPVVAASPPPEPLEPVTTSVTAAVAAPPARPIVTRPSIEQLSPSVDQAALLRDLAERLQARKPEPVIHYAGFVSRAVAFLIDGALLGAFGIPLAAAGYWGIRAGMMFLGRSAPIETDESVMTMLMLAWFVMATIYFTVLHASYGRTIGKALLGIEVRTLHLGKLGVGRALLRTLAYAASSSFLGFGFVLAALTPRKRGWHDFIAGTCVIRPPSEELVA